MSKLKGCFMESNHEDVLVSDLMETRISYESPDSLCDRGCGCNHCQIDLPCGCEDHWKSNKEEVFVGDMIETQSTYENNSSCGCEDDGCDRCDGCEIH
jgi:hypothetical protein